jgi:hypothetical protein
VAISGTQYKEGGVEKLQGRGEELASYYYKGRYILSRNVVNQRNEVIKANRRVFFGRGVWWGGVDCCR